MNTYFHLNEIFKNIKKSQESTVNDKSLQQINIILSRVLIFSLIFIYFFFDANILIFTTGCRKKPSPGEEVMSLPIMGIYRVIRVSILIKLYNPLLSYIKVSKSI